LKNMNEVNQYFHYYSSLKERSAGNSFLLARE
jgi:hypothetical protein